LEINVFGKKTRGHRLAWFLTYGYMPKIIDHINGNKKDNILSNLQYISNIVNAKKGNRSDNETQKNIS